MGRGSPYLVALVLAVLVAAVFAALWYGAYTENKFLQKSLDEARAENQQLKAEVKSLSDQLNAKSRELSDTLLKLQEAQQQLQEKTQQLQQVQAQLDKAQQDLAKTRAELDRARTELASAQSQIAILNSQISSMQAELQKLNDKYQKLSQLVYGGKQMVDNLVLLLEKIRLEAPKVNDTWTFTYTLKYNNLTLRSNYYSYVDYNMKAYETWEIGTTERLRVAIFSTSEFEKYRRGEDARPLAEGRGYVKFKPPTDDRYVITITNDLGRDVTYSLTIKVSANWKVCGEINIYLASDLYARDYACVYGNKKIFQILAIYNYWYNNRLDLSENVKAQLMRLREVQSYNITRHLLYALSLAALYRSAGFEVSLSAIGTSWETPMKPSAVLPMVKVTDTLLFALDIPLNRSISNMINEIPYIGWLNVMWQYYTEERPPLIGKFEYLYLLIDTYNLAYRDESSERTTKVPFNVIYVPEVTKLEQIS